MSRPITPMMIEMLIAHLLGQQPYKLHPSTEERQARDRLMYQGWIKAKPRTQRPTKRRMLPYFTRITDKGREEVAFQLARIADDLDPEGIGFPIDSPSTQPAADSNPACGGPARFSATISPVRSGKRATHSCEDAR